MLNYLLGALILVFSLLIIFVFYVPINWIQNVSDHTYDKRGTHRLKRVVPNKVPPPYPNGWFQIAESREIKPGAARSINCLGENFVVFRSTESKEIFVLDAFCPHLGANLGIGGIVKGDCIECPFHMWKFRGVDGECYEIPYSEKGLSEIKKSARLKKWRSCEINGIIYIWYHAEHEEPWEFPVVREMESGSYKYHGKSIFTFNGHIQDVLENGADVAHLKTLHGPSLTTGTDIRFTRTSWFSLGDHIWDAKWSVAEDKKFMTNIRLTHSTLLWNFKFLNVVGEVNQVGPGYVVLVLNSFFGRVVLLQTCTPLEPMLQKMSHYFYGPRYLAWFVKFALIGESIQVARDIRIWNHKQFNNNPVLVKEDKYIKQYRTWFSQFYSPNSKTYEEAKQQDLTW